MIEILGETLGTVWVTQEGEGGDPGCVYRNLPWQVQGDGEVVDWFERFPSVYNHQPHSSLGYVTPAFL
jgi:hypothetical protein